MTAAADCSTLAALDFVFIECSRVRTRISARITRRRRCCSSSGGGGGSDGDGGGSRNAQSARARRRILRARLTIGISVFKLRDGAHRFSCVQQS